MNWLELGKLAVVAIALSFVLTTVLTTLYATVYALADYVLAGG